MSIKIPDNLNLKQAKEFLKKIKSNSKNQKPTKPKKPKIKIKKLAKKSTFSILTLLLFVDQRVFLLIVFIFFLSWLTIHLENRAKIRTQKKIEKMEPYQNKSEGIKKRMANLKQFKNPIK